MTDELEKAENSAAYNIKKLSPAKQKEAHVDLVNRANKLKFKPFKKMHNPETNKHELHVLVHRGVGFGGDFNPNAKGKNKLNVSPTHIKTTTDSVHSLLPNAAKAFTGHGLPEQDKDFPVEGKKLYEQHQQFYRPNPKVDLPLDNPERIKHFEEADEVRDAYERHVAQFEKDRHKAGKSGILSFWVPISKFNAHGNFIDPEDGQADEQEHVSIKPGNYQRASKDDIESIHGEDHRFPFLHPQEIKKFMTKDELEELIKSANRNAIKAMLRNAATISRPDISDEMKNQAIENVKAIAGNKPASKKMGKEAALKLLAPKNAKRPKLPLPLKKEPVVLPPIPAAAAVPQAAPAITPTIPAPEAVTPNLMYPEGMHLNPIVNVGSKEEAHLRNMFDSLPDHDKQAVIALHHRTKMQKSVDELYNLFTQLKKYF